MYYRNAQSALVVYDVTKPTSFIKARHWVNELKAQANKNIIIALVGNKVDLVKGSSSKSASKKKSKPIDDDEEDAEEEEEQDEDEDEGLVTRKVAREEGEALAKAEGLLFFETSAKSGRNVSDVFLSIANKIPEESAAGRNGGRGGLGADGSDLGDGPGGRDGRVDLTAGSGRAGSQACNC